MSEELLKEYKTDIQKIKFFDANKKAFFSDLKSVTVYDGEIIPKEIDDAFYVYANIKKMSEKELCEFRKQNWIDYPDNFKIFLYDFCILN